MKICINLCGQPKLIHNLKDEIYKYLYSNKHEYYILYSTWTTENVELVREIFPNAFVKQYTPSMNNDEFKYVYENYSPDCTNIQKSKNTYLFKKYIAQCSISTILECEKQNNIVFDIIITTRPDVKISSSHNLSTFFDNIFKNDENHAYVATQPRFDVYNQGAYPDAFIVSKRNTMLNILNTIDIIRHCSLPGTTQFHPETSDYKVLCLKNINCVYLNFEAFVWQ